MKNFTLCFLLVGSFLFCSAQTKKITDSDDLNKMSVDFGYAFSTPHRLSVSLPENSNKTLVDAYPDYVRLKWTYNNLLSLPLASFTTHVANWEVHIKPEIDDHAFANSSWHRVDSWLPVFEQIFEDSDVTTSLQVAGGATAAIVRVTMQNRSNETHKASIHCSDPAGFITGINRSWIQSDWDNDVLVAGMNDRADRIIVFMTGGEERQAIGATTVTQDWVLKPGEKKYGWIIRPYESYLSQLNGLKKKDWNIEFEEAKDVWRDLIGRAAQVSIPDKRVQDAFYAGLADCFIMREPVTKGFIGGTPGTEVYRAVGSGEAGIVAVLLDQVGLHSEAELGYQVNLELQDIGGNWADPQGWAHYMWGVSGGKTMAIMEHFKLTRDTAYLNKVYPRMIASSRWQGKQRTKTRIIVDGNKPLTYGLMPRGMGDCGLMDGEDLFGVFLPHNIWTVYADAQTLKAAQILNKTEDIAKLQQIHQQASEDLLRVLELGAIEEDGYRWIPGVAGKTDGSRWGVLYAAFPCNVLPRDHELIDGTIKKIESFISEGGIPVNTGWLKDGLWVAIALDNLAENLLYRNEGDAAIKYLYATLNHASPLYSWCEERGQEPGSANCTGDLQHLWTPISVSRFLRDALVMEDDKTLHLSRGVARQWLDSGKTIGVTGMATYFGKVSYEMKYNENTGKLTGFVDIKEGIVPDLVIHVRLPDDRKIVSFSGFDNARIIEEGTALEIINATGNVNFEIGVKW